MYLADIETAEHSDAVFFPQPLQSPIDADMDQFTVYLRTSDLRPLGVLNGDWVRPFDLRRFPRP